MPDDLGPGRDRKYARQVRNHTARADVQEDAVMDENRPHWRRLALNALLHLPGSEVGTCLRRFRRLEEASPADVDEYQRRQLLALLRHCHRRVPYYRRWIDGCGLRLDDGFTIGELQKLPILTKPIVHEEYRNLHSDDRDSRGVFRNSSGGSTGKPLTFLQDRQYYAASVVTAKLIYNEFLGKRPGEREVSLWGSERDVRRGSLGARPRALNFLYNRRFLNFFTVDDDKLARFVEEINRFRPVSMWAYVQSLDLLAKFVRRNRLAVHSPRLIISTAGTLHEEIRRSVEATFRCPVYNQYGCREVGTIGFEMQDQDGLRGLPYLNIVEVVDGKAVVTNLVNRSMPLIRYELGDTVEPWTGPQDEQYGCRRKILQSVTGRVHSHFVTKGGGLVYGGYFAQQFFFLDWVRQFQVVQDNLERITCYIVPEDEPVGADMERIRTNFRHAMGSDCEVAFAFPETIQPSPSGKHMYTISRAGEPGADDASGSGGTTLSDCTNHAPVGRRPRPSR